MPPATPPAWLKKGGISSEHLRLVYRTLMEREHQRAEYREGSREVSVPPRLHHIEKEPKKSVLKKLVKKVTSIDATPAEVFYSVKEASTPVTQNYNRYRDIEPYDRNRVIVGSEGSGRRGRYLNASWTREVAGGAWWISAQAPLTITTHAFLSLFTSLQPQSLRLRTIVQLTPIVENGVRKADPYLPWPPVFEELHFFPEEGYDDLPAIEVSLKSQEVNNEVGCVVRTLVLKLLPSATHPESESFEVKHLGYERWPDHSIPEDSEELIGLARIATQINTPFTPGTSAPPILCHCSAGVGRTGTFIAITSLLRAYGLLPPADLGPDFPLHHLFPDPKKSPLGPLPASVREDPIAREVDGLREQRTTMVQKAEQLRIVYKTLVDALAQQQGSSS